MTAQGSSFRRLHLPTPPTGALTLAEIERYLPILLPIIRAEFRWLSDALRHSRELCASRTDPMHDFLHVMRIVSWILYLWLREGRETANLEIGLAAGLFHDAYVSRKNDPSAQHDTELSAKIAYEFLLTTAFPTGWLEEVCRIIKNCSYTRGGLPQTQEEMFVRDADMLDCLGSIGVARFCTGSGMMNRVIVDLDPRTRATGYIHTRDESTVGALVCRSLPVMDRLYTESARAFAHELDLQERVDTFLRQLHQESRNAVIVYAHLIDGLPSR